RGADRGLAEPVGERACPGAGPPGARGAGRARGLAPQPIRLACTVAALRFRPPLAQRADVHRDRRAAAPAAGGPALERRGLRAGPLAAAGRLACAPSRPGPRRSARAPRVRLVRVVLGALSRI